MPLKQCNHSASLLVYQRDGHKCKGGEKKKDRERERELPFPSAVQVFEKLHRV